MLNFAGLDNRTLKRKRVDPLGTFKFLFSLFSENAVSGFVPSFAGLGPNVCGAITGIPFHSSTRAGPKPIPFQAPPPASHPAWPDPEMLRKLHGTILRIQ